MNKAPRIITFGELMVTVAEVEKPAGGDGSGRIQR